MTTKPGFSMHFQHVWEERAADRRYPLWLRVAFLAYGKHRRNGHANFRQGQLARTLGHPDIETGEIVSVDGSVLRRAIRAAVAGGWLAEGSGSRCLVVPAHAISGGGNGHEGEDCPIHERKRMAAVQRRGSLRAVS